MKNYLSIFEEVINCSVDDDAYMESYVRGCYSIYSNKIGAIKDINSNFIMATNGFAELVGLKSISAIINLTDQQLPGSLSKYAKEFKRQDELIVKQRLPQSFIEIQEFGTGIGVYRSTKSPIINPKTNNVIGILLSVEPFQVTSMMDIMLEMHTKKRNSTQQSNANTFVYNKTNISLGPKQAEILFCLSLGIKEDKYIAEFIRKVLNVEYDIVNIKSNLKVLMSKFNVYSRDQLLEKIVSQKLHTLLPLHFLKFGSYYISDTTSIVKNLKKSINTPIGGGKCLFYL